MKALTLILAFSIIIAYSSATPTLVTLLQSQMNQYSTLNLTQHRINETKLMGMCSYRITIKTNCNSPKYSKNTIGILFGDADGKEITVLKVDSEPELFERCKTLIYDVLEHCIGKICKLYVARIGSDGWMPETIVVYDHNDPPISFNYNYFIPEGIRRGSNYCGHQI
ncbi:embryo-specific protein ATS3B-like [Vicia villosa]|uniref:embryo-specific protein ATS3B-like n=1 Tax=Vicia villosa TaxID=3911 RepID=UPI00273BB07C|nr:embryo-specific protein ATS3B-like [Vicia villosa]